MKYTSGEEIQVGDMVQFIGTPDTFEGVHCSSVKVGDIGIVEETKTSALYITVAWWGEKKYYVAMVPGELKFFKRNSKDWLTWL